MRAYFSFLQNFIITKYLKQVANDNLSVHMDERSPCGLSNTGDIKIYQCHVIRFNDVTSPNGECPINFYYRVAFAT